MGSMEIDEDGSGLNRPQFLADAGELVGRPGIPSDEEVQLFLGRFPLGVIFRALQINADDPELEHAAVESLEKVFSSRYGASLLPSTLPAAHLGLGAASPSLRRFACVQISKLLEDRNLGAQYLEEAHLASPLLQRLTDDNSDVAVAAAQALEKLAASEHGLLLLFSDRGCGKDALKQLAGHTPATVRMRALSLAASVSAASREAAEAVARAGVMEVLAHELEGSSDDVLATVSALEIVEAELASSSVGAALVATHSRVPALLRALMEQGDNHSNGNGNGNGNGSGSGNGSGHAAAAATGGGGGGDAALVRARAAMAAARLISPSADSAAATPAVSREEAHALVVCLGAFALRASSGGGSSSSGDDAGAEEAAMDALGVAGMSRAGAEALLLLEGPQPTTTARHVSALAFKVPGGRAQVAAVHALASIAGAERGGGALLSPEAEDRLQEAVYEGASRHVTPGAALWALLQQTEEGRVAAYRLIAALVARVWGLTELCSNADTVTFITNPHSETNKTAMEWRHAACVAAATAAVADARSGRPPRVAAECLGKLDRAARHGPYLTKELLGEAIPIVTTDERPPLPPPPPS